MLAACSIMRPSMRLSGYDIVVADFSISCCGLNASSGGTGIVCLRFVEEFSKEFSFRSRRWNHQQ